MLDELIEVIAEVSESILEDDEDSALSAAEQSEAAYSLINSMWDMHLANKPHIKEYKKIRKLHSEIGSSILQSFYDGAFDDVIDVSIDVDRFLINETKEPVLTYMGMDFDMETDVGMAAFYDIIMHKHAPDIPSCLEEFIKKKRYRRPDKIEMLKSMLDSELGLYEVTGVDSEEGYVYIKEVFTEAEYKLTDVAMSAGIGCEDRYLYLRIITYGDTSFNAGFTMPFRKEDSFIVNFIKRHKKGYNPNGVMVRFLELYNYYKQDENPMQVHRNAYG